MDTHALAREIRRKALDLGFERVGFCDAAVPEETRHFEAWLAEGMHATMGWLETGRQKRMDPQRVLEGARSLIVVALTYAGASAGRHRRAAAPLQGTVARYAHGDDYHKVVEDRLALLERFIQTRAHPARARAYVDTGPLLERMWAARAGIGWVGKNALVLNKDLGSFFFLGIVLTTLALPADAPALDQCGSCTLCIEACPTGAIVRPRVVDSRACIAYHTIELRGSIPPRFREAIGGRVFGCDDCQEACPWNRQEGSPAGGSAFPARPRSVAPSLVELLSMTHEEYLERFRGSAIKRATYQGLRRNAAVSLGNRLAGGGGGPGAAEALAVLERVAGDENEPEDLREQAAWAAGRARPSG